MQIITDIGCRWQLAHLAVACVSTEGSHADEILSHVLRFIERSAGEAQVTDLASRSGSVA